MLRLLTDQNFDNRILRGLKRRVPDLDAVRAQDVGLSEAEDPDVLAWAAQSSRVVLTHDVSTMTHHAHTRVRDEHSMPGLIEVPRSLPIGQAVEDLHLLVECSLDGEWEGQVIYLPLK